MNIHDSNFVVKNNIQKLISMRAVVEIQTEGAFALPTFLSVDRLHLNNNCFINLDILKSYGPLCLR